MLKSAGYVHVVAVNDSSDDKRPANGCGRDDETGAGTIGAGESLGVPLSTTRLAY